MAETRKPARSTTRKSTKGITDEEKDAMRELVRERRSGDKADGETLLLEKIAEMAEPDRIMAERLHAVIKTNAPELSPTTWYGMPAYAKGGDVLCFFQPAKKFKTRYATFGFNHKANLDEGNVWPIAFALMDLTAADEARIAALVKRATS